MEIIKCRTCLILTYKHDCTTITTKCYLEETIKQAILRLVPEMNLTLQDDDAVCKKCTSTLKRSLRFVETCLTVESLVTYNNNISNTTYSIEVPEFETKVDEIENIRGQINSDHNYVKQTFISHANSSSEDDDDEEEFNVDDPNLSEEIVIESSLLNNDTKESYSNLDCAMSPIKIIIEEPSLSPGSDSEESIKLELLSPETAFSTEELEHQEVIESIKLELHSPETAFSTEELEHREVIENESNDFTCPICLVKFFFEEEYERHVETHVLLCEFCGEDFSEGRENQFKAHMDEHKKVKTCEFCGVIVQDSKSLRNHILSKHRSSLYLCDKCPKSFTDKYLVAAHIKGVHQKATQKQCTACGKFFVNLETCKNHYKLVHLKLKPYLCAVCGKKFGRSDYLERHKARHGGVKMNAKKSVPKIRRGKRTTKHGVHLKDPGKPVNCNICGKELATVHLLKGHLESHVKIKRYKCDYCDITFSMLNNKKRHEKSHQKDSENKYRCNICWKRMQTREQLDHHVKSHDKPPQHACDMCDEKFHRKYLLDNHIADKHFSQEDIDRAVEEIVVKNLLQYANPNII